MENLAKAIIKVMQEVKGMEKNSKVGSGNYGYSGTKDQDVKEIFNAALAKNGLCILPTSVQSKTHIDRWTEGQKTKQSVFTEVETKYILIHETGESIELAGYGHGVDPQDKGAGKATTYALKNCLLYAFLTPVGKIDDADTTHSNDMPVPDTTHSDDLPIPKTTKEQTDDLDLQIAITAINGSKTLDDLKKNFEAYNHQFGRVFSFSQAKDKKKKELTPKS